MTRKGIAAACLALLVSVLAVAAGPAQALDKVKVIIPQNSVFVLNWRGANDAGVFRKHGIDLEVDVRPFAGFLAGLPSKAAMVGTYSGMDAVEKMNQDVDWAVIGGGLTVFHGIYVPKDSPIKTIADLKGKKVGVPFNSTTHFHTIVALEQAKINPADVQILNMRPPEVRAAWQRGDIHATFIWDPVLAETKKDGTVILTSGKISADTGKATFDGYIVNKDWAKANRDFMVKFVKVLAKADENYRAGKAKFTKDSAEVKAIAKWSGAKPENVPDSMALYAFPTAKEQATKWLGGKDSVAAKALAATADFQLSQKQIEKKLPDYSVAVNPTYVQDAMK
jgi:taurine transport system substrate-binding protein